MTRSRTESSKSPKPKTKRKKRDLDSSQGSESSVVIVDETELEPKIKAKYRLRGVEKKYWRKYDGLMDSDFELKDKLWNPPRKITIEEIENPNKRLSWKMSRFGPDVLYLERHARWFWKYAEASKKEQETKAWPFLEPEGVCVMKYLVKHMLV